MARRLRLDIPDGSFHVWNRGVNRADIVFDDEDRERFVNNESGRFIASSIRRPRPTPLLRPNSILRRPTLEISGAAGRLLD